MARKTRAQKIKRAARIASGRNRSGPIPASTKPEPSAVDHHEESGPYIIFPDRGHEMEALSDFIGDGADGYEFQFGDTYIINKNTGDVLIPPHSQRLFEVALGFVEKNKPFITLDSDHFSPDLLAFMGVSWHNDHRIYAHIDLNVLSRLNEIMEGEKACPPDNPKDPDDRKGYERRWALMALLSLTYVDSVISYEILIPEFASKNGKDKTDRLLMNINTILNMKGHDIMAALCNGDFRPGFTPTAHPNPFNTNESTANGRFIGNYRNMLELARRLREGQDTPKGVSHLESYMRWLHDNSFRSTAAIITAMYVFAEHNPQAVLKKVRSRQGNQLLEAIVNQAWDCTHMMDFVHPGALSGRRSDDKPSVTVFLTRDKNLRGMIEYMHKAILGNVNLFSHHFTHNDADHLYSVYKELFDNESNPGRLYNQDIYHHHEVQDIRDLEMQLVGESGYTDVVPFSLPSARMPA